VRFLHGDKLPGGKVEAGDFFDRKFQVLGVRRERDRALEPSREELTFRGQSLDWIIEQGEAFHERLLAFSQTTAPARAPGLRSSKQKQKITTPKAKSQRPKAKS
jgi:hypothetical protein